MFNKVMYFSKSSDIGRYFPSYFYTKRYAILITLSKIN